jgi:hypothetical protein
MNRRLPTIIKELVTELKWLHQPYQNTYDIG